MLELYREGSPYSETVRKRTTELDLSYVVHNPRLRGGEDQIPFLVDHRSGKTLYESDDIVEYLDEQCG